MICLGSKTCQIVGDGVAMLGISVISTLRKRLNPQRLLPRLQELGTYLEHAGEDSGLVKLLSYKENDEKPFKCPQLLR